MLILWLQYRMYLEIFCYHKSLHEYSSSTIQDKSMDIVTRNDLDRDECCKYILLKNESSGENIGCFCLMEIMTPLWIALSNDLQIWLAWLIIYYNRMIIVILDSLCFEIELF